MASGVLPLSQETRGVGSRVAASKQRTAWSFLVRQTRHDVVLLHSPGTGKIALSVDGRADDGRAIAGAIYE